MATFNKSKQSIGIWFVAGIAIIFGIITIKAGASVLFIGGQFRVDAGNYVPFVLWFNFLAGFVYLIAGVALWMQKSLAVWISVFLASSSLIIFAVFGIHILRGGDFETRTIVAMSFRTILWALIALFAYRKLIKK